MSRADWDPAVDDPVIRWSPRPSPFDEVNAARVREGLEELPSNEVLNRALHEAGFTHCLGRPYLA